MTSVLSPAISGANGQGAVTDCPFPGLNFYTESDTRWFFGREVERRTISANLRGGRLTLLYAESGVGKSSLLRAGVAAKLHEVAENQIRAGRRPQYLPVVFKEWKDEPTDALARKIADTTVPTAQEPHTETLPSGRLIDVVRAASESTGATFLVILDQFEEYFVYRAQEREPGRFGRELAECVNSPDARANFLIAIREDAYAGLGDLFAGQIANVYGNYLHLDLLTREEGRVAITCPIDLYNGEHPTEAVRPEDGLVDAVLDEVQVRADGTPVMNGDTPPGDPGSYVSAPLLQLVMRAIWDHERNQSSRVLRLSSLSELDVASIVDAHLGKALQGLSRKEQTVATGVFDHLVTASGGKIAEPVADLAARTGYNEETVGTVLEKLDHARIVRPVPAPPDKDPHRYRRYEIFHDVLSPAINRAIETKMSEQRLRRARRILFVSLVLLLVVLVAAGSFLVLWRNSVHERDVAQSTALAALAERDVSVDPELATLLALRAERISPTPQAYGALADALPAIQEIWTRQTPDKAGALTASFSPNGKVALVGTSGGQVDVFGQSGRRGWFTPFSRSGPLAKLYVKRARALLSTSPISSAVYNDDGSAMLVASTNGMVGQWSALSGKILPGPQKPPTGWGTYAEDAVYNAQSTEFAAAEYHASYEAVDIWSSSGQFRQQIIIPDRAVYGIAFSPDGTEIATAESSGSVEFFSVQTGQRVGSLPSQGADVSSVEFSPDGGSLLAAYKNDKVIDWTIATGFPAHTFTITDGANQAVFGDDGQEVIATSDLGLAIVWNVSTGAQVTELRSNLGPIEAAAFDPAGDMAVTANNQGAVSMWYASPHASAAVGTLTLLAEDGPISTLEQDPRTGDVYATTSPCAFNCAGTLVSWDPRTGAERFATDEAGIRSLQVIPGRSVLAVNHNGSVSEWSLPGLTPVAPPDATTDAEGLVYSPGAHLFVIETRSGFKVGPSLDLGDDRLIPTNTENVAIYHVNDAGTRLLVAGNHGYGLRIFKISNGQLVAHFSVRPVGFHPKDQVTNDAEFSADSSRLVVAQSGGNAYVFDANSGAPVAAVGVDTGYLACASFSPKNDNEIVTAGADGMARVWDIGSDTQLEVLPDPRETNVTQCGFTPNGNEVVTASGGGTLRVWSVTPSESALVGEATATIDRVAPSWVRDSLVETCDCSASSSS
jgi:WD40 repeat protein